jgi:hypothetical protein
MNGAKDFFGKRISVGNQIVYPGRSGSSLWMNSGIVECVSSYNDYRGDTKYKLKVRRIGLFGAEKKTVQIDVLSRVVVI